MQRKIARAGTKNSSFKAGSDDLLDYLELAVDVKQVERMTKRLGAERCTQRDAEVQAYMKLPLTERKDKPADVQAPSLAVVSVDGGRLQIRDDSWPSKRKAAADLTKPVSQAPATPNEETTPPDDRHHGTHWREDKIGVLMPMQSEEKVSDPCPRVPANFVDPTRITKLARELKTKKSATVESPVPEVVAPTNEPERGEEAVREAGQAAKWQPPEVVDKHLTATRQPWAQFGPIVATKAWQLGFFKAQRRAFVGDGSDNVWTVWRNHFSSFVPILDIIHAISYLFAAATADRPFAEGWACYVRWMTWTWAGEIEKVIAELAERQAELGVPAASDGDTHPRVVVSTALRYLQNHKDKMRYAEYRRQGLPITSSYVESAVKQFNQRVTGTEKFWTEAGAEALLQLRADFLSPSSVLEEFWQERQANATGQNSYAQAA